MKHLALVALLVFAVTAFGQERTPIKPKEVAPEIAKQIVTEGEANKVFARAEAMLRKKLALDSKAAPIDLGTSAAPVSREKVVAQFSRLYELSKPKFKLNPKPVGYDPKVLKMDNKKSLDQLVVLLKAGAIAERARVAVGPADTLTVKEFGDTLGYFLARIAQLPHMPIPEYSRALMDR